MAAVTVPSGRSRIGKVTLAPAARFLSRLARPVRAPLVNLASIPLHVAGLACIDAAAFTGNLIAGLVVTGLSLIWLEHVIADEP